MAHFSAHCKTFIFPFFFFKLLWSVEGIKMEWNKLENRVTPVLFYPVLVRTHMSLYVMMHFRCILKMNGYGPLFLFVCVSLSICPSICDVLDVCFISFIVIFNSKANVIQLIPYIKRQRTDQNRGWHIPSNAYYKFNVNQMNWSGE